MNKNKIIIITAAITAAVMFVATTLIYLTPFGKYLYFVMADKVGGTNYSKLYAIERIIEDNYMGNTSKKKLAEGAAYGYVAGVGDVYTSYLSKKDLMDMISEVEGKYIGIGVEVRSKDGKIFVTGVKDNSPADKAGIVSGDYIIGVNGVKYGSEKLNEAIAVIKSTPSGNTVKLIVEQNGENKEMELTTEEIKTENVVSKMINPQIGYVRVRIFGNDTSKDFIDSVEKLKQEGMQGLIIDLRSNPGGILDSVVEMVDYLVPQGTITTIKYKNKTEQKYTSDENELDMPICVLINEDSASASEIMAGALKDFEKAVLIGKTTYGKGVVQGIYQLADDSAVRVTVAKYYTPSDVCIDKIGVTPHYEVDLPEGVSVKNFDSFFENDTQMEKALEILNQKLAS